MTLLFKCANVFCTPEQGQLILVEVTQFSANKDRSWN